MEYILGAALLLALIGNAWQAWRNRDSAVPTLRRERDDAVRRGAVVGEAIAGLQRDLDAQRARADAGWARYRALLSEKVDSAGGDDLTRLRDDVVSDANNPDPLPAGTAPPAEAVVVHRPDPPR